MFPIIMSNSISISDRATISCCPSLQAYNSSSPMVQKTKKKRNLPGNPDPDAEVIALSPRTLLATNRFVCEICNKGFQRDQNLQLHRRGHNLPWKLKQRNSNDNKKRAYVCPEPSCVHHQPSRALGDLTGIKKHYCRKHGEKKWKCDKCSKIYAVQSDWKAHSKICGAREHKCDCGTLFSRKDSLITHKAYCEALAKENGRLSAATQSILPPNPNTITHSFNFTPQNPLPPPPSPPSFLPFSTHNRHFTNPWDPQLQNPNPHPQSQVRVKHEDLQIPMVTSPLGNIQVSAAGLSASAAASAGPTMAHVDIDQWQKRDNLTRDFLGLAAGEQSSGEGSSRGNHDRDLLSYAGGVEYTQYDHDHEFLLKNQGYEFAEACWKNWGDC